MIRSTLTRLLGARGLSFLSVVDSPVSRAAIAAVEALEDRTVFGGPGPTMHMVSTPPTVCDCLTPGALGERDPGTDTGGATGADPGGAIGVEPLGGAGSGPYAGDSSGSTSSESGYAPIRGLDGSPVVSSVDLSSDAFGKSWSYARSWGGMNQSSQNGNGWVVTTLPYLAIRSNVSPHDGHSGIVTLVEGGQAGRDFDVDDMLDDTTSSSRHGRTLEKLVYTPPTRDGSGNKVPGEFTLTDGGGNVLVFYDLPRTGYTDDDSGTNDPVEQHGRLYAGGTYVQQATNQWFDTADGSRHDADDATGTADAYRFGALKSFTDKSGRLTITTKYDANANLTALTRTDGSGHYEQFATEYDTYTNANSASAVLVKKVTLQRGGNAAGPWTPVSSAEYDYYSGTAGDATDRHGRFGDLKTVVVRDYQRNTTTGEVVDQKYYRYVKQYGGQGGSSPNWTYNVPGPTNDMATTGGADTDFAPDGYDDTVFSGLKSTFEGASFARLAAARGGVAAFQDDADADVDAYADHTFRYQRTDEGSLAYPFSHFRGQVYQVIQETAAGAGCSTCSGGFGTYRYDYKVGYASEEENIFSPYTNPNRWAMRSTQYLPDTTNPTLQATLANYALNFDGAGHAYFNWSSEDGNVGIGDRITIAGANQAGYNGSFVISGAQYDSQFGPRFTFFFDVPGTVAAGTATGAVTLSDQDRVDPSAWDDNDQEIAYLNESGQVMLRVVVDRNGTSTAADDKRHMTYYRYDDNYRLVAVARPEAIRGYSEAVDDLVYFGDNSYGFLDDAAGEIDRYEYATSTTASLATPSTPAVAGDVKGHIKAAYTRRGFGGTEIQLSGQRYFAHADGVTGAVVYPVAERTAYWDVDLDGTDDALTTKFDYDWVKDAATGTSDTNRVASRTVTLPAVDATRNGSGDATSMDMAYDALGRVTWTRDADGFLTYTAYDDATGAVVKTITDVDDSQTGTFAGKPSAWGTPSGGGLHLTTTYEVDDYGRPTKETDPKLNVTYWVYDDTKREVRRYRSAAGTFAQVGPVEVTRTYWPAQSAASGQRAVYTETLTSGKTPALTGGVPDGSETIAGGDILSLSRSLTNDAGQTIEVDAYHDLTGAVYAQATPRLLDSGGNVAAATFYATKTDYDARGRLKRVQTPTGTVTRMLYDARGLPTQTWVGTDDSPTTGFWSPSNTAGTNLTLVSEYRYDSNDRAGQAAPAAPSVTATSGSGFGARSYSVRVSYVNADGETVASSAATISLGSGDLLKVTSPAAAGTATGYHVYFGTAAGGEIRKTSAPVAIGTDWTEATSFPLLVSPQPVNVGEGSGLLTATIEHPTGTTSAADDRASLYYYDWRNRLVAAKGGARLDSAGRNDTAGEASDVQRSVSYVKLDTAGHATATFGYDGDGVAITSTGGVPVQPSSSALRASSTTEYDDLGRAFASHVFGVDPSTGTATTNALTATTYFDDRGNVIETSAPGGLVSKARYDGAGRTTKVFTTDGGGHTGQAYAADVSADHVLEQTEYAYDANGNVILTTTKQRFHDATDDDALGTPASASGTAKARVYYAAEYYDALDRITDSVDAGTNGGSAYTRLSSAPSRSDTELVTSYTYDAAGRVQDVTDPRGIVTRTAYDLLGRTTSTTEAYDPSVNSGDPTASANRRTVYTYDGSDHVLTMTADLPSTQDPQTTRYIYGVGIGGSNSISSNDLLAEVRYPAKGDGTPGADPSDQEHYTYNAVGQPRTFTDRNGNIHTYGYDVLGRQLSDAVSPGNYDVGNVLRLQTAYNSQGLPYRFTSYDAATGGTPLNEVERVYNGLGQMTVEYQEHAGAVVTSTSAKVQYAYTEMASGANHSRLKSMTYPDGRMLRYEYVSGLDNDISRVTYLADDSSGSVGTHLEEYSYLGLGTVVRQTRPQPGTELTYLTASTGDAGDYYGGLDRFGRVVNQQWLTTSTGAATDQFKYGYDRDGNPLYRLVESAGSTAGYDQRFAYDKLNRLVEARRGTASGTVPTISAPKRLEMWGLDALGNWGSHTVVDNPQPGDVNLDGSVGIDDLGVISQNYDKDGQTWTTGDLTGDGTVGIDDLGVLSQNYNATGGPVASPESRTHNDGNQITSFGGEEAPNYDYNGNLLSNDLNKAPYDKSYSYDAWNRMTSSINDVFGEDYDTNNKVGYTYDALGRRIGEVHTTVTPYGMSEDGEHYQKDVDSSDRYYSAGWQLVQEDHSDAVTDVPSDAPLGSSSSRQQYVWGLTYVDDMVLRDSSVNAGSPQRIYVQHDANHNVTSLTSSAGAVAERFVYDSYGQSTGLTSSWTATGDGYTWLYRHQGGRMETSTGLYAFRFRDYDSSLGTWIQGDPIGYLDGMDVYEYISSNPFSNTDSSGLAASASTRPATVPTSNPTSSPSTRPYTLPTAIGGLTDDPGSVPQQSSDGWNVHWADVDGGEYFAKTRMTHDKYKLGAETSMSAGIKGKPCITAAILAGESRHIDNYKKVLKVYHTKFGDRVVASEWNSIATTLGAILPWSEIDAATEAINALDAAIRDKNLGLKCKCTETKEELENARKGLENFRKKQQNMVAGKKRPPVLN